MLARMAGAGSGECGWIREVMVLDNADDGGGGGCDDEEMERVEVQTVLDGRRARWQAPARTSFAAYK